MSCHLNLYLLTRLDMPYTLHSTMLVSVCYHVLYTPSNLTSYIFQGVQICHSVTCSSPCCCKCILYTLVLDLTIAVSGVGEEIAVVEIGQELCEMVVTTKYKQRVFSLSSVYISLWRYDCSRSWWHQSMITYLTILPDLSSLAGSLLLSPNRRSHVRCGHPAQKRSTGFPSTVDSAFKLTCITYLPSLVTSRLLCWNIVYVYVNVFVCITQVCLCLYLSMLWVLFLFFVIATKSRVHVLLGVT